jgi:Protein of unknown function (DUF2934)
MHKDRAQAISRNSASIESTREPNPEAVKELAYQLWILRARPTGSSEVDWFRAEQELKYAMQSHRSAS